MEAVNRPNAGHDGDPNDVLRDHGIEDLKARLDEAFDPGAEEAFDPGNTEYDEAGKRFDEVPPNEGEAPNGQDTGDASPNEGGAYHIIGDLEASKKLCIAKGAATATAIYKATGIPCAAAGDMLAAAKALKLSFPDIEFIVCADDDWKTKGNPGKTEARKAAPPSVRYWRCPISAFSADTAKREIRASAISTGSTANTAVL